MVRTIDGELYGYLSNLVQRSADHNVDRLLIDNAVLAKLDPDWQLDLVEAMTVIAVDDLARLLRATRVRVRATAVPAVSPGGYA